MKYLLLILSCSLAIGCAENEGDKSDYVELIEDEFIKDGETYKTHTIMIVHSCGMIKSLFGVREVCTVELDNGTNILVSAPAFVGEEIDLRELGD